MRRLGMLALVVATCLVEAPRVGRVEDDSLRQVTRERVLFGHQSVGWNILDSVNTVYSRRGVTAPDVVDSPPAGGPGFSQVEIGSNSNPKSSSTPSRR